MWEIQPVPETGPKPGGRRRPGDERFHGSRTHLSPGACAQSAQVRVRGQSPGTGLSSTQGTQVVFWPGMVTPTAHSPPQENAKEKSSDKNIYKNGPFSTLCPPVHKMGK